MTPVVPDLLWRLEQAEKPVLSKGKVSHQLFLGLLFLKEGRENAFLLGCRDFALFFCTNETVVAKHVDLLPFERESVDTVSDGVSVLVEVFFFIIVFFVIVIFSVLQLFFLSTWLL